MSVAEKINKEIIQPKKMGLLVENPVYKPFRYPWCYDAWLTQQRIHWLPEEVPLGDDVRDWQKNLTQSEKNLLTYFYLQMYIKEICIKFTSKLGRKDWRVFITVGLNQYNVLKMLMTQIQLTLQLTFTNQKKKVITNKIMRSVYHVSSRKN